MPLFSSSGERAIVLVFVHWHAEVLLKEGRFMAELQAGIYLNISFPAFKTIIFSCFRHQRDQKSLYSSTTQEDRSQTGLAAGTCWSHGKADNSGGTFLYRLADIVEICTEQTKSFPQRHHLHSSATLHSSIALCWFVPGTHFFPPVQNQLSHCYTTLISAIPLILLIISVYSLLLPQR